MLAIRPLGHGRCFTHLIIGVNDWNFIIFFKFNQEQNDELGDSKLFSFSEK